MPFVKGQSGNPSGGRTEKLFYHALLMQLKAAGEDMPRLRKIADALLDRAEGGDMAAINAVADRLDGKPHSTAELTVRKHDATDYSLAELVDIAKPANGGAGSRRSHNGPEKPDSVH